MGVTGSGGVVRGGVVRYIDNEGVNKFVAAVRGLVSR